MSKWLNRALAAVPIVPKMPKTLPEANFGNFGNFGTQAEEAQMASEPPPSDAEVASVEWQERAAILEYDEGLPRDEAERLATGQVRNRYEFDGFADVNSPAAKPSAAGLSALKEADKPPVGSPALRPANWLPEPSPGVRILRPAVEVGAAEYDQHLDAIIAALPHGSDERARLVFAKSKGWVVERNGKRIFNRGRA